LRSNDGESIDKKSETRTILSQISEKSKVQLINDIKREIKNEIREELKNEFATENKINDTLRHSKEHIPNTQPVPINDMILRCVHCDS